MRKDVEKTLQDWRDAYFEELEMAREECERLLAEEEQRFDPRRKPTGVAGGRSVRQKLHELTMALAMLYQPKERDAPVTVPLSAILKQLGLAVPAQHHRFGDLDTRERVMRDLEDLRGEFTGASGGFEISFQNGPAGCVQDPVTVTFRPWGCVKAGKKSRR